MTPIISLIKRYKVYVNSLEPTTVFHGSFMVDIKASVDNNVMVVNLYRKEEKIFSYRKKLNGNVSGVYAYMFMKEYVSKLMIKIEKGIADIATVITNFGEPINTDLITFNCADSVLTIGYSKPGFSGLVAEIKK